MYGSLNDAIENTVQQAKPGTSIKALNARYSNVIEASVLCSRFISRETMILGETADDHEIDLPRSLYVEAFR